MENNHHSYSIIKNNNKLKVIFILLFLALFVSIMYIFKAYLWPFLFALIFYIAFSPLHTFLSSKIKKRTLTTIILLMALVVAVIVPLFFLLVALSTQTIEFYDFISHNMTKELMSKFFSENIYAKKVMLLFGIEQSDVLKVIFDYLKSSSMTVFSGLSQFIGFSLTFLVNFFFMILFLSFLFQEAYKFKSLVASFLPFPEDVENEIIDKLKKVVKLLVAGNFLIMLSQGIMVAIGFAVSGIGMWLIAGTVAAIFSLIPVIGTAVVWVPAALYLLVIGKTYTALFISIWCVSWYLILENILKPAVFGKTLNFPPIIFFFLLLGSLSTFGLPGVLVGPILLTLFYSLWEIYKFIDIYDRNTNHNKE